MTTPLKRTFVVIHGVGRQPELDTLRTLIEGFDAASLTAARYSREELRQQAQDGILAVDDRRQVVEINYASLINGHAEFSEDDLRRWLRTFKSRLERIHDNRGGSPRPDFSPLEYVVDDILFTTTIAKFIAERLKVRPLSLETSAQGFLQQIQLFVDRPQYRDEILEHVTEKLAQIAGRDPAGKIVLVTHSLGTVVGLMTLLHAQGAAAGWLRQIERFVTFGSPIDLLFVLFPELFPPQPAGIERQIAWTNYVLRNDPIATDLKVVNESLTARAPGLFQGNTIRELVLGNGSLATAHTDYWHHLDLLHDIFDPPADDAGSTTDDARPPADEPGSSNQSARPMPADPPQIASRPAPRPILVVLRNEPTITIFFWFAVVAVLASAWVALIWWEENVKLDDAKRVILLDEGHWQLAAWVLFALMIGSHAVSWSRSLAMRLAAVFVCLASAGALIAFLPRLTFLGRPTPSVVESANWVLLSVPAGALLGAAAYGLHSSKRYSLIFLAFTTIGLSLFVGTRSNPSNVTEEFWTLALVFGFWMLAILLLRIDRVYRKFVRGRKHIDKLHELWNQQNVAENSPAADGGR